MLNIERILKQERLVRAMTGLNLKAFKALESSFEEAYQQSLNQPEKERKRQQGGGRKATLRTTLDKMLYILMYIKCYPTFDLRKHLRIDSSKISKHFADQSKVNK